MITTTSPDDFDSTAMSENLGEEITILTFDELRLARLQNWSRRLNLTPEAFLLKGFDLLCARLAQASNTPGIELTPDNKNLFQP